MSDDFLRQARTAWQAEHTDVGEMLRKLRRKRWAVHRALTVEWIGGAAAFMVGVFFFAMSVWTHQLLFILSAVVLLVGMPLSMSANLQAHRTGLRWEDETPEGVVATVLRRAETSLKTIRIGRWGVLAIGAFVAVLWIAQAAGLIRAASFLKLYTAAAFITCAPYLLYLHRRERRALGERAACQRMLDELVAPKRGEESGEL